jgi:hypothetical protein
MSRLDIVRATYDAAERLNALKRRYGLIDEATYGGVAYRLSLARRILDRTAEAGSAGDLTDPDTLPQFSNYIHLANQATMFGQDEMKWPLPHRFRVGATLIQTLAMGLIEEVGHTVARACRRYDVAPANGV